MDDNEIVDLSKLIQARCRKAAATVLQLCDTDDESAALLAMMAMDFIQGAAELHREHHGSDLAALGCVVAGIIDKLGVTEWEPSKPLKQSAAKLRAKRD